MTGVTLDRLAVAYDRRPAIHDVSGRFEPGSMTAVVGANGAGKSSLLKALAGVLRPTAGSVTRDDRMARVAYLPQQSDIDRDFPISVGDAVLLGRWHELGWFRTATRRHRADRDAALRAVGLAELRARPVATLSVGQFQRMLFARLMLRDAGLILLDEPFTALDERTTQDLLAMVARWHGEGRTIVAVLHDMAQVRRHFPETMMLARSCLGWGPTTRVLTAASAVA